MTLLELKTQVDDIYNDMVSNMSSQSPHDIHVLITLDQPSIGARASSGIKRIGMGFDWEHGQLRIQPEKKIIEESKSRSVPRHTEKCTFGGVTFTSCVTCGLKVAKDDGYCRHCGQRLL